MKPIFTLFFTLLLLTAGFKSSAYITIGDVGPQLHGFQVIWNDDQSGTMYVDVSESSLFPLRGTFSNNCDNCNQLTVTNSSIKPGTLYYIRVRSSSQTSSIVQAYTVPEQPEVTSAVANCTSITYEWADNNPQNTYYYEFSNESDFSPLISSGNVTGTTVTISNLSPSTFYYFRIRATTPSTYSIWTETSTISTTNAPNAPSPYHSNVTCSGFKLNWSGTSGLTYDYQVSKYSNFSSLEKQGTTTNLYAWISSLPAETYYYYRVRVTVSPGCTSDWGTGGPVRTDLNNPTGLSNTGITYSSFNATWNSVTCATGYDLQISKDNTWNNGNDCGPFSNTDTDYTFQSCYWQSSCSESLQDGEKYYWRVRAKTSSGVSGWSYYSVQLPSAGRKDGSNQMELKPIEPSPITDISIYPNPAVNEINISAKYQFEGSFNSNIDYKIMDQSGKLVQTGKFSTDLPLDISNLNKGVYFINLTSEEYSTNETIVKN